jgi:hypothetical protein
MTIAIALDQEKVTTSTGDVTKNDRFSAVLVAIVAAVSLTLGLVLRQTSQGTTWTYENAEAGIQAQYPAGWLADEDGIYLARIRDPKARPFKTQYLITVVPAGGQTSVRNVLDSLTLQRSVNLPAYRVISVEQIEQGDQVITRMEFVFVDADPNPFIERLPVVVHGIDRIVLDGNRAIIATLMAENTTFEANREGFERFVASLRY